MTTVSTHDNLVLMMDLGLSQRQIQILKCMVEEYMASAEPVGSELLEKKYNLGVSPATIRNEMATLTDKGLLQQPHTSAGRTPTPMAMKFYVDHLMQEKKLSVTDEVKAKEEVWDARANFDKLLREAAVSLASRTHTLSVVATDTGDIYYAGAAYMLQFPEFADTDVPYTILSLLDQQNKLRQLFFERTYGQEIVHVVFGADLGWPYFEPVATAFTHFSAGQNRQGMIGVIGPCRLNFPYVIPTLKYFANLLTEMTARYG